MEESFTDRKVNRTCDSCRSNNMVCSGTLPCNNCYYKQSSTSMTIECTYNEEVKQRLNGLSRTSNKAMYNSIEEKMDKFEKIISSIDYSIVDTILNDAINLNNYNRTHKADAQSFKKRKLYVEKEDEHQDIKKVKEGTKILRMGIKAVNKPAVDHESSINNIEGFDIENILINEECQLREYNLNMKLFYYLNPNSLKKLISTVKIDSIDEYKSSIHASEVFSTLNDLLEKVKDLHVKNLFHSAFETQFNPEAIVKIPAKIMEFIKPKILESNDFFLIKVQKRVLKLYELFEDINASTDENGYIKFKGKMNLSETNLVFTILLNNITLYKHEKADDKLFFEDLVFTETVLLKFVFDFYKIFAAVYKKSDKVENNVNNIQSLLHLAFYLENSYLPDVSSRIISSCIAYIQLLHYNDSDYINRMLPNEDLDYPETLKFQIRSLYLTCYKHDTAVSLRCHKPGVLNTRNQVLPIMSDHTRDLMHFYQLNKGQSSDEDNEYINIFDKNTEMYRHMICNIDGFTVITQNLSFRVSHLHSLAYKYLIATKNENDPLEVTLQKKHLVLENLKTFKGQVRDLFGFSEMSESKYTVSRINQMFASFDEEARRKLAWKYITVAMDYCMLVLVIHLSDLETLHDVETKEDIINATRYCENPMFLMAIKDCLETSIDTMEFNGFHKFESRSVLFCTLLGISSAFNVCIFNQSFFKENKDLIIKVVKLTTKTASKEGFIDTLIWSAISVLGMSILRILFELNSNDSIITTAEFQILFKEDYPKTVEILKEASKMTLHVLDTKRFKEYVKDSKTHDYQRDIDNIINSPLDKDVQQQCNLELNNEVIDNLNAEIESVMDKEIMKLSNVEGNGSEYKGDLADTYSLSKAADDVSEHDTLFRDW